MSFEITAVCFSNTGSGQINNEDNFYFAGKTLPARHHGILEPWETRFSTKTAQSLCLFDGVSEQGAGAGALSRAAADGFSEAQRAFSTRDTFENSLFEQLLLAMNRLVNRRKETTGLQDAGTSALCVTMNRDQLYVSWVGDSSIFCVRQGKCRRLNEPQPGFSKLPAQYLGLDERMTLDPRVLHGALMDGDLFLLCSGNVAEKVPGGEIANVLTGEQSLIGKGRTLEELAKQYDVEGDVSLLLFSAKREDSGEDLFADAIAMTSGEKAAAPAAPAPEKQPVPATPLAQKDDLAPLTLEDFENEPLPQPNAEEPEEEKPDTDQFGEELEDEEVEEEAVGVSLDSILARIKETIPQNWKPLAFIGALILVVLIVAGVVFGGDKVKELVDQRVDVPVVTGMTEDEAADALQELGLVLDVEKSDYSDTVKEGEIISQDPKAGTKLDEGAAVSVVLSLGEEAVMPDLTGMTEKAATSALKKWKIDLIVSKDTVYSENVKEGKIAEQSIKAGESLDDSITEVEVKLSKGSEYVDVPSMVGMSQKDAADAAEELGLKIKTTEEYSDSVASGEVISQNVKADESKKIGSTIEVTVSKGPKSVSVPYVVGQWQSEAEPTLQNLGFVVKITAEYSETVEHGRVLSQSVTGSATPGSTITLCVSIGSRYPEEEEEEETTTSKPKEDKEDDIIYVG